MKKVLFIFDCLDATEDQFIYDPITDDFLYIKSICGHLNAWDILKYLKKGVKYRTVGFDDFVIIQHNIPVDIKYKHQYMRTYALEHEKDSH